MSIRIDIRFLERLPEAFIQQSEDLSALREADADHDGFIVEDLEGEEQVPIPQVPHQEVTQFLRRIAQEEGRPLTGAALRQASRDLTVEFALTAQSLRNVVEMETVSLSPLHSLSAERFRETHADQLFWEVDTNRNGAVDGIEMRDRLFQNYRPEFPPLRSLLDESAENIYQNELSHRTDSLPTLLHVISYLPRHIIQPILEGDNVVDGLITGWNYLTGNVSTLYEGESSPYSWRGGLALMAERRHIRRIEAIQNFEDAWSRHPHEEISAALNRLSADDQRILREDLHVSQLLEAVTARTPEARGRAFLDLARISWNGPANRSILGEGLAEFAATRWYADNEIMASSLYTYLSDPGNEFPTDIRNAATEGQQELEGNGRSFLSNLLIDRSGERWPARQRRFNYLWDQFASIALELLLARGAVSGVRWVGMRLLWPVVRWGGSGIWTGVTWAGSRLATLLGRSAPAVGEVTTATAETATLVATETTTTASISGWRAAGALALRGLGTTGRGLDRVFRYGSYGAGFLALHHGIRPPGESLPVNYSMFIHSTLTNSSPEAVERPSARDLHNIILMNLVNIQLQINEQIRNGEIVNEPLAGNF